MPSPPVGRLVPAGVIQLIEIGIRLLRRHWLPLLAAAALLGGIGLVITALLSAEFGDILASMFTVDALGRTEFNSAVLDSPRFVPAAALSLAGSLIGGAFLTVASLVASVYVDRDYHGSTITLRAALARALNRSVVAIAASFLTLLAIIGLIAAIALLSVLVAWLLDAGNGGPGALLVLIIAVAGTLAAVTVGIRLSIASVIVALEPVGPVRALRRSWHLTGDNAWRTFGLQFMVLIVISLVSTILAVAGTAFSGGLDATTPSQSGAQSVISLIFGVVTAPILPVMLTVLYFDLRVRRDRFELSLEPQP